MAFYIETCLGPSIALNKHSLLCHHYFHHPWISYPVAPSPYHILSRSAEASGFVKPHTLALPGVLSDFPQTWSLWGAASCKCGELGTYTLQTSLSTTPDASFQRDPPALTPRKQVHLPCLSPPASSEPALNAQGTFRSSPCVQTLEIEQQTQALPPQSSQSDERWRPESVITPTTVKLLQR